MNAEQTKFDQRIKTLLLILATTGQANADDTLTADAMEHVATVFKNTALYFEGYAGYLRTEGKCLTPEELKRRNQLFNILKDVLLGSDPDERTKN